MRINEAGDSIAQRAQGQGGASASGQPASASGAVGAKPSARTRTGRLAPDDAAHPMPTGMKLLSLYIPLLPSILGLCFARAGLIVAGYGSYTHTDEGIFTDGSMLGGAFLHGRYLACHRNAEDPPEEAHHQPHHAHVRCIGGAVRAAASPGPHCRRLPAERAFLAMRGRHVLRIVRHLLLAAPRTRMRQHHRRAVCASAPFAISEVEIYVCSLIGTYGFYVAAALSLLQFPCMLSARKNKLANDIESFTPNDDFIRIATRRCRASASSRRRHRTSACSPSWTASCAATPTVRPSRSSPPPGLHMACSP